MSDPRNIKADYSATGDGTSDDVTKFQNGYNALPTAGGMNGTTGGAIYVPEGRYRIGTPGIVQGSVCAHWFGYNYGSSGISPNQVATQLRRDSSGAYPIFTLGPEMEPSLWYGSIIEGLSLRDGGGNGTAPLILQHHGNFARFERLDLQNCLLDAAIKQVASLYDPQYTKISDCTITFCKYGIYQDAPAGGSSIDHRASDTEVWRTIMSSRGFGSSGADIIAGSIGIKTYNTMRVFGGAIQNFEVGMSINGDNNKVEGTAFENTLTGGVTGIDVVSGNRNIISLVDFGGAYSDARIHVRPDATNTLIITTNRNDVLDEGVNTTILGPA